MWRVFQIRYVLPIIIVALIWVQIPSNAKLQTWRQRAKESELHIVAGVANISVLQLLISPF